MAMQDDTKPFDALAHLADAYDALAQLAFEDEGHSSPTCVILINLNRQFRSYLDSMGSQGLLS